MEKLVTFEMEGIFEDGHVNTSLFKDLALRGKKIKILKDIYIERERQRQRPATILL